MQSLWQEYRRRIKSSLAGELQNRFQRNKVTLLPNLI